MDIKFLFLSTSEFSGLCNMLTLLFNLIVIVKNTSTAVTAAVTTISIDVVVKLKLVVLFNVYNSDIVYIELEIT